MRQGGDHRHPDHPDHPGLRPDGLQLDEHRAVQIRYWRLQRVSWVVFALIVLVALAGFLGSGGLFDTRRIPVAGAELEMPRVLRWQTSDAMLLRLPPAEGDITLSSSFFEAFGVERIQPEPVAIALTGDGQRLSFDGGGTVVLTLRPASPGLPRFSITAGGETRTLRAPVLP